MRWSGATGAIARCKSRSTVCARTYRSVPAWHWICGVKPTPKAGNKPSPHSIMHGLDKPGVFTTVSFLNQHPTTTGGFLETVNCNLKGAAFSGHNFAGRYK